MQPEVTPRHPTRPAVILAALAALLTVGLCALAGAASSRLAQAADYPGATRLADDTLVRYTPSLVIRRTSSYRTSDPFPAVYNWYSRRFQLGPESHAQSNCILMARSYTTLWLLKEQVTVTVCGTPNGQMMFVSRSGVLRLPW